MQYPTEMENESTRLLSETTLGGIHINMSAPPAGLRADSQLGVIYPGCMAAERMHRWPAPFDKLFETRSVITPAREYLVVATAGKAHYGGVSPSEKVNDLFAYRSSDRGATWSGPSLLWEVEYNQHGFVPLIPRGSARIYAFVTEPMAGRYNGVENAVIGYRYSDDDGYTWSEPQLIEPRNDPGYEGMSVIHMTETDHGVWLLGSHTGTPYFAYEEDGQTRYNARSRQYILRSEDQGHTWTLVPGARPNGWYLPQFERMDEIRVLSLSGGNVLALTRTCEGHLWELRSEDDGKSWSEPQPSPIVHPDAPAMLFKLSDGHTLACFHHNRHTGCAFNRADRSELWVSLSVDDGYTWEEPRFVIANADADDRMIWGNEQEYGVSYVDLLVDHGELHLFVPHRFRQLLHLRFTESDLHALPTRKELV